ncbi:WD40 repeat domain-containing protein [Helicobacter sp.]|uniref:WD40 repeat domain-containing protein n=1 Tax=Helicobacter sp. TaxID=218 RepID=UPI0025BC7168|nr:WD40 repeat domain-containing protein [Helicobacter sp.]MCI5968071.1 WD40 repeat domain-containing protein [Helicobacter sp.]MDY2584046.1 WD40 repeat domain-containing protein [Helicobacter sp.]
MLPLKDTFSIADSVLGIAADENKIYAIDNRYNVYVFSHKSRTLEQSTSLKSNKHPLFDFSKAVGFANQQKRFAIGFSGSNVGSVISLEENIRELESLTWQKKEITNAVFSPNDTYLATGGECGRIVVYYGDNYNFLLSSSPFSDAVSTISFSDDEHYALGASFSGELIVADIPYDKIITKITFSSVVEDALFDKDNTRIFCITRDGETILYDLIENKILSKNQLKHTWLTLCKRIPNTDFALIGSRDNLLYLVRISSNKLVETLRVRHQGITAMHFYQNFLFLGYSDGVIESYDTAFQMEAFLRILEIGNLRDITAMFYQDNIFLCTLKTYKEKLDAQWKEALKKAIVLLSKNSVEEAVTLVDPFMRDLEKKQEFNTCLEQIHYIADFIDTAEEKNYIKAYALAEKYPSVKNTLAYEKIEQFWQQVFNTCQTLLIEDATLNINKAKKLLSVFASVESKKGDIQLLLNNANVFLEAEQAYKNRNIVPYFSLCEKFHFLKETKTYKKAIYTSRNLLKQASILEKKNEIAQALKLCEYLNNIPLFKDITNAKLKTLHLKEKFLKACADNNIKEAFNLAETSIELKNLQEFKTLYDAFLNIFDKAFKAATNGEPKIVLELLKDYTTIGNLRTKINTLLKAAYLKEFQSNNSTRSKNINWHDSFNEYIKRYGKDEDIIKVAKELRLYPILEHILESKKDALQCSLIEPMAKSLIVMETQESF